MKADVLSLDGKKVREIELPACFDEKVRLDIIKKAFEIEMRGKRTPYGAYMRAGKEYSASGKIRHARRKWKTAYGRGISRIPRKIMSRRGTQFRWEGAYIPGTKGGRGAHPPKAEKNWEKKINKKERVKAIKSAIAASANAGYIIKRYENLGKDAEKIKFPIIIESRINDIDKARMFEEAIKGIIKNLPASLIDVALREERKIRAGKGKERNRKYKKARGVLIITSRELKVSDSLRGKGVDIISIDKMNIENLAPAGIPGRIIIYTEDAIKEMEKINRLK